jgi:hypothetical protein
MIFAAGSLLISKVALPPRAGTCLQFFAHTWLSLMKRLLAAWSDISNQVPVRPLPRSISCRRMNDGRLVLQIRCACASCPAPNQNAVCRVLYDEQ